MKHKPITPPVIPDQRFMVDGIIKASERDKAETLYRYGDSFTNNIRKAHIKTIGKMSIVNSIEYIFNKNRQHSESLLLGYITASYRTLPVRLTHYKVKEAGFKFDAIKVEEIIDKWKQKQAIATKTGIDLHNTLHNRRMIKDIPSFMVYDTISPFHTLPSRQTTGKSNFAINTPIQAQQAEMDYNKLRENLSKLYDINILGEFVSYTATNNLKHYKKIITEQINSKSVKITFSFGSDPYITIQNNNIDLTIKDPVIINQLKSLILKTFK